MRGDGGVGVGCVRVHAHKGTHTHTQKGMRAHRHPWDLLQQTPMVELVGGGHPAAAEGDDSSPKAVLPCRSRHRHEPHWHPGPPSRGAAPRTDGKQKPPEQPHLT